MLDIAERDAAWRATLTDEEREAVDLLAAKKQQREHEDWHSRHAKAIDVRKVRIENGQLPDATSAPIPIAAHLAHRLIAGAKDRGLRPFEPQPASPPLSREEQVEAALAGFLATHEADERRRAALSPTEQATEDRERHADLQRLVAETEHEQRTMLWDRRDGDDEIHKLSRAELTARGVQPLFALRRGSEDVYFEPDNGAWIRIETNPEYVRSGAAHLPSSWPRPENASRCPSKRRCIASATTSRCENAARDRK